MRVDTTILRDGRSKLYRRACNQVAIRSVGDRRTLALLRLHAMRNFDMAAIDRVEAMASRHGAVLPEEPPAEPK